jgi:hypothetical protein
MRPFEESKLLLEGAYEISTVVDVLPHKDYVNTGNLTAESTHVIDRDQIGMAISALLRSDNPPHALIDDLGAHGLLRRPIPTESNPEIIDLDAHQPPEDMGDIIVVPAAAFYSAASVA